jgi:ADP-ribose pyrophosphatase YjhB (NUDIX family)
MARPVHKLLRKGKRELRNNKFRVTKLCAQAYVNNFGVCGAYCQETGLSLTKEVTTQTNSWKVWATKLAQNSVVCLAMRVGIRLTVPRQRIGVGLVAVNEAHEVFMLRHVFHPYYQWGLPGGWLKKNEAPAAGVLRELWEETGLTAVLGPAVSVHHDAATAYVGIAYVGQLNPGDLQLSHEIIEAQWFPYHALPGPITTHTELAIQAAVAAVRK